MDLSGFFDQELFYLTYNSIYAVLSLFSVLFVLSIDNLKYRVVNKVAVYSLLFFSLLFGIIAGLRKTEVGTDTITYYFQWVYNIPYESFTEIGFYYLMRLVKLVGGDFNLFLLVVSLLYYYFLYKTSLNISKYYNTNALLFLFLLNSLFFSMGLSINIIRQGLSLSLLIYAYSLFINKGKRVYLFLMLSVLAHNTSIIPILIFIFIYRFEKNISLKYFLGLYFFAIIISYFDFGILDITPYIGDFFAENDRRAGYLSNNKNFHDLYSIGFKPQFVMFNTVFLFFFIIARKKKHVIPSYSKNNYETLLKYFLLSSVLLFMTFQLPFSDRWGLFSWITIPILIMPYFSQGRGGLRYKTPIILFFILVYVFFNIYINSK